MSDSSLPTQPRTAQLLGALYRELIEEGVPEELSSDIVRDAAQANTARSLTVKTAVEGAQA